MYLQILSKLAAAAAAFAAMASGAVFAQGDAQTLKNEPSGEKQQLPEKTADAGGTQTLDAFEVTAFRFGDSLFDMPVSAQNISSQTIDQSGLTSVPEVLRRYACVNTRNNGSNPFTSELSMRGFGENSGQRVLVLLDGQRLNTLDLSFINWAQLPLEEIDNIEVLKGPQTAAYGNYAESGVIKISTKRWNQPDSAKIGGFYGTDGEYSAYARAAHSGEDYFASANMNYYHNSGSIPNSLNWNKSAGANAGVKLDSKNEFSVSASGGNAFIRWPNPISSYADMIKDPTANTGTSSENNIYFTTISALLENKTDFGEGAIQFGTNMRDVKTLFPSTWGDTSNKTLLWTSSFTPRYRLFLDSDKNSYVEAGVDFYYDNMTSKRYSDGGFSQTIASSDIERTTVAPWVGGKYALNDIFSLSAGGRYEIAMNEIDHRSAADNYDESKNFSGLAAQFGINAKVSDTWNLYMRFDQVYRYPAIDEMASYWGYGGDFFNPNLKPERGQNYEIGTNYLNGPWRASCSAFFMHLDEEIVYNPYVWTSQNIGASDRYGAEVSLAYELEMCGASTSWTFVSSKFDGGEFGGERIPLVPTIVSSTRVWVRPVKFFQLALEYEWTSQQYMASDFKNEAEQMPAFWNINIVANFFVCDNARIFVAVNNATDEKYASYAVYYASGSSWYPAVGRTIRAGVEFKF